MTDELEKIDADFLNEALEGQNIFEGDEAVEGMKRQAEALGIDPESVDLAKMQKVLYAKQNCKHCYGRGVMVFIPSPCKSKKIKANIDKSIEKKIRESRIIKVKGRKGLRRKPTQKRIRVMTELPGNALGEVWNIRRPEPHELKKELRQHLPCRCVRTLEIQSQKQPADLVGFFCFYTGLGHTVVLYQMLVETFVNMHFKRSYDYERQREKT